MKRGLFIIKKHKPTTIWQRVWGFLLTVDGVFMPGFIKWQYYGKRECPESKDSFTTKID